MDQIFAITEMIDLTRTLGDLVARETAILHSRNPHQIGALQDEKFELATRYAAALSALRQNCASRCGRRPRNCAPGSTATCAPSTSPSR